MSKSRKYSTFAALGSAINLFGQGGYVIVRHRATTELETVNPRSKAEAASSPWRHVGRLLRESAQDVQTRMSTANVRKKAEQ